MLYHTIPTYTLLYQYHHIWVITITLSFFPARSSKFCTVIDLDNTHRLYHVMPYHKIPNYTLLYQISPNLKQQHFSRLELQILHGNRSRQYPQTIPCHTMSYHTILYLIIPNIPKFKIAITQTFFELGVQHSAW